jgi:hypothetical protein
MDQQIDVFFVGELTLEIVRRGVGGSGIGAGSAVRLGARITHSVDVESVPMCEEMMNVSSVISKSVPRPEGTSN